MKLVIASSNRNKIREIENKFSEIPGLELVPLNAFDNPPEVVEDGDTFEENSAKKAKEITRFTGLPAMADDSGLVVAALDGRPGVHSARYGGDCLTDRDRYELLLGEMNRVPLTGRRARFVCVITIAMPDGSLYSARGECEGVIAEEPKGGGGFGYDPIFYLPKYGLTMAEISLEEKNRISHRARALDRAAKILSRITAT